MAEKAQLSEANASLNAFIESAFPLASRVDALLGDASTRKYYRGVTSTTSFMVMDSSAEMDAYAAFLKMTDLLLDAGQPVPQYFAKDDAHGYMLLEDFGQMDFANLGYQVPEVWLPQALSLLANWQAQTQETQTAVPRYDADKVQDELSRFGAWFIPAFLPQCEISELETEFAWLTERFLAIPQVLVHRDYHGRNLMIKPDQTLGIIDYQDAVWGAAAYDVISLTRDCYHRYPHGLRQDVEMAFRKTLGVARTAEDWAMDLEVAALQRHIKVLGQFVRLAVRDGKPRYLRDLPLVWDYAREEAQTLQHEMPKFAELLRNNDAKVRSALAKETR